jgi:hypothetical protein
MTYPAAFWPGILGILFFIAGIITYRRDFQTSSDDGAFGLTALGPVFVAASLAAFAGEHFSSTAGIASIVPKWIPAPLFIAYFVGVAHLAAATSFVARRYVSWSSLCLAVMFGLFVALMDLPGAFRRPELHIVWSLAARQATFAMGGLALFATVTRADRPSRAAMIATIARFWTAFVLVFYGIENILFPQFAPGVPDVTPVAKWIPMPSMIAYITGGLLVAFGIAMFNGKRAAEAAKWAGVLMTLVTAALYVPQWVIARDVGEQINGINFVFDTLLFAGTMFLISRAIPDKT